MWPGTNTNKNCCLHAVDIGGRFCKCWMLNINLLGIVTLSTSMPHPSSTRSSACAIWSPGSPSTMYWWWQTWPYISAQSCSAPLQINKQRLKVNFFSWSLLWMNKARSRHAIRKPGMRLGRSCWLFSIFFGFLNFSLLLQTLCSVLGKTLFLSQCLSPPRSIKWKELYRRIVSATWKNIGGNLWLT